MLFLAGESCDFAVVRALRSAGHDVSAVAEIAPRADDDTVLAIASKQQRLLLTEDKDFGQLVYADERATGGVLLIRWPFAARASLPSRIVKLGAPKRDRSNIDGGMEAGHAGLRPPNGTANIDGGMEAGHADLRARRVMQQTAE